LSAELVQLNFHKIMQTRAYTVIVLSHGEKRFAIYTEPSVGKALQMHLTGTPKPRPLTHDLVRWILKGLDVKVKQVVINDLQETTFFSRLFLEQEKNHTRHIIEMDCRPSDAITLALLTNAPVYSTRELLETAIPFEE